MLPRGKTNIDLQTAVIRYSVYTCAAGNKAHIQRSSSRQIVQRLKSDHLMCCFQYGAAAFFRSISSMRSNSVDLNSKTTGTFASYHEAIIRVTSLKVEYSHTRLCCCPIFFCRRRCAVSVFLIPRKGKVNWSPAKARLLQSTQSKNCNHQPRFHIQTTRAKCFSVMDTKWDVPQCSLWKHCVHMSAE